MLTPEENDFGSEKMSAGDSRPSESRNFNFDHQKIPEEYRAFFSTRSGVIQSAFNRCRDILLPSDGEFRNCWLLTLVNHWDVETERIVLLTEHALCLIKYDFIQLSPVHVRRVHLSLPDRITVGNLSYPPLSLAPRLSGLASGMASVIRGCLSDGISSTVSQLRQTVTGRSQPPPDSASLANSVSNNHCQIDFKPRYRCVAGVQMNWGQIPAVAKWNPLARDLPSLTLCSHPLFWCREGFSDEDRQVFSVESFTDTLCRLIGSRPATGPATATRPASATCVIQHADIVVDNYLGLLSVLFNTAQMGFFKARGKISF